MAICAISSFPDPLRKGPPASPLIETQLGLKDETKDKWRLIKSCAIKEGKYPIWKVSRYLHQAVVIQKYTRNWLYFSNENKLATKQRKL